MKSLENPKFLLFDLTPSCSEEGSSCGKKDCCEKYKRKGKHCKSCPKR